MANRSLILLFLIIVLAIPLAGADLSAPSIWHSGFKLWGNFLDMWGENGVRNGTIGGTDNNVTFLDSNGVQFLSRSGTTVDLDMNNKNITNVRIINSTEVNVTTINSTSINGDGRGIFALNLSNGTIGTVANARLTPDVVLSTKIDTCTGASDALGWNGSGMPCRTITTTLQNNISAVNYTNVTPVTNYSAGGALNTAVDLGIAGRIFFTNITINEPTPQPPYYSFSVGVNVSSTSGNGRAAIYTSSGNAPSTLLSQSAEKVLATGINIFDMPPILLENGTKYWAAFRSSDSTALQGRVLGAADNYYDSSAYGSFPTTSTNVATTAEAYMNITYTRIQRIIPDTNMTYLVNTSGQRTPYSIFLLPRADLNLNKQYVIKKNDGNTTTNLTIQTQSSQYLDGWKNSTNLTSYESLTLQANNNNSWAVLSYYTNNLKQ